MAYGDSDHVKDAKAALNTLAGKRLREARILCGLSQKDLGLLLGVTYQQIQKYESGKSKVTFETLYMVCKILHIPSPYFFAEPQRFLPTGDDQPENDYRDGVALLESWSQIERQRDRHILARMAGFMAE